MIPLLILGQHHQVVTTLVLLTLAVGHGATGHIHLAADNRLEDLRLSLRHLLAALGQGGLLILTRLIAPLDGLDALL